MVVQKAKISTTEELSLPSKRVLNIDEACAFLGLAKSYIYKLTMAGILPFSKPNGKVIYFEREKLEAWMLSNPSSSQREKETAAATYVTTGRV